MESVERSVRLIPRPRRAFTPRSWLRTCAGRPAWTSRASPQFPIRNDLRCEHRGWHRATPCRQRPPATSTHTEQLIFPSSRTIGHGWWSRYELPDGRAGPHFVPEAEWSVDRLEPRYERRSDVLAAIDASSHCQRWPRPRTVGIRSKPDTRSPRALLDLVPCRL